MIAVRRATVAILVRCLGSIEGGRKDLLEEGIECFTQWRQGRDEDADGKFCRAPYAEIDAGPSRVSRLGDSLQFDRLEYGANCGTA